MEKLSERGFGKICMIEGSKTVNSKVNPRI